MSDQARAYLYAAGAVTAWATVASAFKLTLRHVAPLQMLCGASGVSMLFLFAFLLVTGRLSVLAGYSRRQFGYSLVLGLLNPAVYYAVLFAAYDLLPAQEALTLNYTWPIMLVVLSVPLLGQRIGYRSFIAMAVSFAGVAVVATRGDIFSLDFARPFGSALALGSALIWGLFWIGNVRDERDEVPKLLLNFCFGFPVVLVLMLIFSGVPEPGLAGWVGIAYVGLFEMGLTFVLWLKALSCAENTATVSNLIYLTPFLSLLVIRIVVGEPIRPWTLTGLVLIVGGIVLQHRWRNRGTGEGV